MSRKLKVKGEHFPAISEIEQLNDNCAIARTYVGRTFKITAARIIKINNFGTPSFEDSLYRAYYEELVEINNEGQKMAVWSECRFPFVIPHAYSKSPTDCLRRGLSQINILFNNTQQQKP